MSWHTRHSPVSYTHLDVYKRQDEDISLDYLLKIIQELPDRYRLVFNLYVNDDFSHAEIAEMLSITIGKSKSNLSRARMILKDKIEQYKNEENKTFPSAK